MLSSYKMSIKPDVARLVIVLTALVAALTVWYASIPRLNHVTLRALALDSCGQIHGMDNLIKGKIPEKKAKKELVDNCELYNDPASSITLPYSRPQNIATTRFRIEAELVAAPYKSNIFRITPDDCIDKLFVNDQKVKIPFRPGAPERCWPRSYTIDLGPYLEPGKNKIKLYLSNDNGNYGLDISGRPAAWMGWLVMGLLAIAAYMALFLILPLYDKIQELAIRAKPYIYNKWRQLGPGSAIYWQSLLLPFVCALLLAFNNKIAGTHWHKPMLPFMIACFSAMALWLYSFSKTNKVLSNISAPAWMITVLAMAVAMRSAYLPEYNVPLVWIQERLGMLAIVSALFVRIGIKNAFNFVRKEPRYSMAAVFAGASPWLFYWLIKDYWQVACGFAAKATQVLLSGLGLNITAYPDDPGTRDPNFILGTDYWKIQVFSDCSGFEGICLFIYLLSMLLMMDWNLLKRYSMTLLYSIGVFYMMAFNVLRISSLYTLGYFAYDPGANVFMREFKGAPVAIFHSYVGWTYYLVAFSIFAWVLYKPFRKKMV